MPSEPEGQAAELEQALAGAPQRVGLYGLDEAVAFDLLRWRSQSSNVKLRRLAEIVVERFRNARDDAITSRSAFDHALLRGDAAQNGDEAASPAAN